jgi:phosphatidylglycerol:prolipoprotein diacylglycerol transferase
MHPVLLEIGSFKLHTYGLMAASSWLFSMGLVMFLGKRRGEDPWVMLEFALGIVFAGVIGSRLQYVLQNADQFQGRWERAFALSDGGLVFLGGLFAAVLFAFIYARQKRRSPLELLDMMAPSGALSMAIGRIGCFNAGCCYGRPAHDLAWAVIFTDPETRAPIGMPLHPTQLYLSVFNWLLCAYLVWLLLRRRRYAGQVVVQYLSIYAVGRIVIEFFRGDSIRGYLFEIDLWGDEVAEFLSTSQSMGLLMIAGAAALGWWARRRPPDPKTAQRGG